MASRWDPLVHLQQQARATMENDTTASASKKNTVYVGGFAEEVREQELLNAFVAFGEYSSFSFVCTDCVRRGYHRDQPAYGSSR
jgi:RNA recognition motif-containing protein